MPTGQDSHDDKERLSVRMAKLSSLGVELGVAVVVGFGLGYWLDRKLGTQPWLMVAGLLLGAVAGMKSLIQAARKATLGTERKDDKSGT